MHAVVFVVASLCVALVASQCTISTSSGTFDITPLASRASDGKNTLAANWYATETSSQSSRGPRDDFIYYFSLCGTLLYAADNVEAITVPNASSVNMLQVVSNRTSDHFAVHVVGYSQGSGLTSLSDGDLRYIFGPGDYANHCGPGPRRAIMLLFCSDTGIGTPVFSYENDYCEYVFVWNTCAACAMGTAVRDACPAIASSCGFAGSLSTGSILLIVFFTFLGTYLIFGVLYQRFIAGARGWEQLPNFGFWSSCLSNAKGGCEFTFCSWARPKPLSVRFKGMEEEEGDDTEELTQTSTA